MAFKLADRVKEFTSSSGTGGVSFTGAAVGFRRFRDVLSDGDTTYYVIEENDKYEIGIGTYGSDNLERTQVLVSSNNNTQVNLGGSGVVFITYPADHAIFTDPQNEANIGIGNLTDAFTSGTPVSANLLSIDNINKKVLIGDRTGNGDHTNTLIGYGAGSGITTAYGNTVIGANASTQNQGGFHNVHIGVESGPVDAGATNFVYNSVAVGYQAGSNMRHESTVVGHKAGSNAYEIAITALGYEAGEGAGSYSISIGKESGYNSNSDYSISIGHESGYEATGQENVWIGYRAGYKSSFSQRSVGVGFQAGSRSQADDSIYLGRYAGYQNTTDDLLIIGRNKSASNGTLIKGDMSSKKVAIGKADVTLNDTLYVGINSSIDVGLVVQSAAAQSSDFTQWKNSNGDVLAKVKNSGIIEADTIVATGTGYYFPDGTVQFSAAEAGTLTNIYQNAQGHIGVGVINPRAYLHVSGDARIDQDLVVAASGLVIGSGALSGNYDFVGMKHTAMTGSNDYMIISSGTDTFVSAANDSILFLRGGGNAAESEIRLYDVAAGNVGIVFNEAGVDRDVRMEGAGDTNLFRLDASTDSVGIGTHLPEYKLDVRGNIQAKDTFAKIQTVDGSVVTKIQSDSSASVGYFGTESNNDLRIRTNNTDIGVFTTDGSMGLGKTSLISSTKLDIDTANKDYGVIVGGTNGASISFLSNASITGVKSAAYGFYSFRFPSTSDAQINNLIHFRAGGPYSSTASSTAVTSNIGFYAASGVRYNASNAFGFYGGIEEGSNHWNLYMFGSGQNYLAGNVGIGTDTPQYPLEVHSNRAPGPWINQQAGTTGDASTIVLQQRTADVRMGVVYSYSTNYDGGSFLSVGASGTAFANIEGPVAVGTLESKPLTLGTANVERIRVAEGGYVGIGTSEPAYKLDVAGTGNFDYLNVNDNDSLLSIAGNASKRVIFNEDAHADYDVRIEGASDVNLFRTDGSSNKVGVGLIPSSKFHVSGGVARFDGNVGLGTAGSTNVSIYSRNQTSSSAAVHYGFFMQDDVGGGCTDHLGFIYSGKSTQNSLNSYSAFVAGNAKTITASTGYGYYITSGALIGSVNNYGFYSLVKKDGDKNYNLYMDSEATNYLGGNLGIMTTTPSVPLSVYPTGISDTSTPAHDELFNKVIVYQDNPNTNVAGFGVSTSSFNIATSGSMHQRFWTNSIERMRVSSNGNIGIGTTNPTHLLDVSGSARVNSLNINSEFTLPTSDGVANQILKTDGAGNVFWSTTAAAGIGAVIDDLTPQLGGNLDLNDYEIHGTGSINIMSGSGIITHEDGKCGLVVQDTGGSGVHIGDCAYGLSSLYSGMKHSEHTNGSEYMIISRGLNTFVSAKSGASSFIRAGANSTTYQAVVSPTFFGVGNSFHRLRIDSTGAIFNTGCTGDLDFQVNPFGDEGHLPLIHADAALHSVGIGTNAPDSLLHVKNTGVVTDFKNVVQIEGDIDTNSSPYTETLALVGTGLSGSASIGFGQYSYSVIKSEHDTDGSLTAGKLDFYIRSTASSPTVNMTLNSSGNLIVTPENNNDYAVRIGNKSGGGGSVTGVTLIGLDHWNPTDEFASAEIGVVENSTASYKSNIVFNTRDTSANVKATEKVRITHDGNIGVGTTEPALQSAGRGIHIHDTTSSEIKFTNDTTESTATDGTALVLNSNSFTINNREVGDLFFSTSNTQRMQILYQGDVRIKGNTNDNLFYTDFSADRIGIGTDSPDTLLHVDGTSKLSNIQIFDGNIASPNSDLQITAGGSQDTRNHILLTNTGGITLNGSTLVTATNKNIKLDLRDNGGSIILDGGNVGINNAAPAFNLDITGSGRITHNDGKCGLFVEDTNGSGIHLGDCAYSSSSAYSGMKHSNHSGSSEYMIISSGHSTFVSSATGAGTYLRAGNNDSTYQALITDTTFGIGTNSDRIRVNSQGVIFNNDLGNYDFRIMPFGVDRPTLHVDASSTTGGAAGRIGVGRYADDYMIDVSGGLRISPLATATRNISVNRNASTPSITADGDTAENQWLIMDSAGMRCALNYFVSDDVVLAHGGGGVGIGTNAAPGSYALRVEGGTSAFNASQIEAANFRVFGEDDDALIFGDAGLNQVGLGTSVPRTKLEVFGSGVAGQAKIEGTILSRTFHHDSYAGLLIRDRDDVNIGTFQHGGSGTNVISNEIAIGSRQDATPVVFYQGAASAGQGLEDRDKRLTFDTDRNAVFQTGVNVGIGDTSPNVPLSITPASYAVTATPNIDEAINKLRLYDVDGNGVAGFGISTSTFNIATSGAINQNFWTNGSRAMQIGHSAQTVGIGADATTAYHLYVHTDITNSTRRGAYIDIDAETTETEVTKFNIGQTIDLRKNVHHEIRDSGYALGLDVNGLIDGSGYSRYAYGARTYGGGYTGFGEGGVIDHTYGLYSRALNFGSGTMVNAYGLFSVVQKVHSAGTITNAYGLYINAIGTNATNPYGIYQAGTSDDNYLAGNVMIGRTTSHEFTGYKTLSIDGTNGSFIDLYDNGTAELRIQGNTEHQTIQTLNLSPLRFSTNQIERMRIGPSGNVGIGTTTPAQVLDVTTSETEGFGINLQPPSAPAGSGDHQSLITENRSDSIITKHLENVANGSSTLVMKNLIRYGADFVSIDGAYTTGLGTTFDPKLLVNTDSGYVGIGTSTPSRTLDVLGSGRFVHSDGTCGLVVEDTGGSGVHIGDCAYLTGSTYTGMKHSAHTNSSEYMIISRGDHTFLSAKDAYGVIIRGGNNNSSSEIRVYDATSGTNGVVINEQGSDVDTRIEGANDQNLLKVDASADSIGIGTNSPAYKLDVAGSGGFDASVMVGSGVVLPNAVPSDTSNKLYNDAGTLKFNGSSIGGGGGISSLVEDTTPQLGGNLDLNNKNITGIGNINITGSIDATSATFSDGAGSFTLSRVASTIATWKEAAGSIELIAGAGSTPAITITNHTFESTPTVTINDDQIDMDFRVEGDSDENLLYADASADSIGVGTNSPAYKLDVAGSGGFDASLMVGSGVVLPNAVPPDTSDKLYNDAGTLKFNGSSITGGKTDEEIQDIVGGMVSGNTESGISVTYDDAGDGTGKLNFAVASQTDENFTTADHSKLDHIEALADVTDATNVDAAGAVMNTDTSTASMDFVIDEDNMASDSNTKVPTQQSVKAYVDTEAVRPSYIMSIMFG